MKSKLSFLTGVSLKRKIKTKWFVVVNVILAIFIIGLMNIDTIIKSFGGNFDEETKIYLFDDIDSYEYLKDELENSSGLLDSTTKFELIAGGTTKEANTVSNEDSDVKTAIDNIFKEEENAIVIEISLDEVNTINSKITTKDFIDTIDYQVIVNALNNLKTNVALANSSISPEELNKILEPITVERVILDEDKNSEDENGQMIMTTVFPIIILPFFMLSIFLVQMIGAEVNDEKSTRGMEIIISSVSPKTHFASKVLAGNLFVIIQGALLFIFGAIGLLIRKASDSLGSGLGEEIGNILSNLKNTSAGDNLIYIIPLTLLIMLVTFIAYSLLAGILASMTTNIEDFQQVQTPIIIVSLVGYYLATMSFVFDGAIFIKVLSFVPYISAILMPSLLMMGQATVIEAIIAIIIMCITNFLLIKYGMRIYKVGILNYSSKNIWKKIFKATKNM